MALPLKNSDYLDNRDMETLETLFNTIAIPYTPRCQLASSKRLQTTTRFAQIDNSAYFERTI